MHRALEHQVVVSQVEGAAALLGREPAHRVSPRAKWMWLCSEAISSVVVIGILIWVWTKDWIPSPWDTTLLVLAIVEAFVCMIVQPQWRYRVHRYEVTDQAVYTQHGWLNQERRIAPIPRIQTVDTERGPLAQLFKLSTVTVTTASAKGALRIVGLDRAEADRIAADLTRIAAADGGDGT